MTVAAAVAIALLTLALFLDEAVIWFARQAVETSRAGHDERDVRRRARSALQSRLLSRAFTALAFGILIDAALESAVSAVSVAAGALVWVLGATALSGVRWGSPLTLAGRVLFRPFRWLGAVLRGVLVAWGRLPGPDFPAPSLERAREIEAERRWLRGIREESEEEREEDDAQTVVTALREFGSSRVEDVMVRREAIVALPAAAGIPEIVGVVKRQGFSRYPVYTETLDGITGVLHVFDLFGAPEGATAASLARAPFFTNDTKPVGTLLRELQVSYNQMAIVVDEYGGTAGIVTIEDLLEELVGEIGDEHDEEDTRIVLLEPGAYRVDGTVRVDEVNEALRLELTSGEYDTVAGLVLDRLERVPRVGERVRENGVWIEVLEADPHRVRTLKVSVGREAERER